MSGAIRPRPRSRAHLHRTVVTPPVATGAPIRSESAADARPDARRRARSRSSAQRGPSHDEFRYFLDHQGRQHFNFRQRVWLDASVQMACTSAYSTALATLAVNLLTYATRARDYRAAVGLTSRRALALAPAFSRECLLSAPDQAWVLSKSAIRAWLDSHRPGRKPLCVR